MAAIRHLDDEDDEFLSQLASAEAEALSRMNSGTTNKRRKFGSYGDEDQQLKKMAVAIDSAPKMKETEEGAYMAALRGSKSVAWQQNPLNRSGSRVKAVAAGGGSVSHINGGGGSERQQPSVSEKDCPCGQGACVVFTANTERNRGRQFFRCPVRQENGGCGFFEWCDNASGNNYNSSAANSALQCPCGAGFCKLLTAKTGKNVGQQFYCCPASQESACGFFKWFNETEVAASLPPAVAYTSSKEASNIGYAASAESSPCFKCGQTGHWAKDCTVSPLPNPTSAYNVSKGASNIGYGARTESSPCFKCNQPGHWAKDCTVSPLPDPTSAYNVSKNSSNVGNNARSEPSPCFKCGQTGHWAKDCTISPLPDPTSAYNVSKGASNIGYGARAESSPCFKCGQTGHWAKDCTVSASSDPRATASFGGGSRPASQSSSACYKCSKPGHWARDCTSTTQSTAAPRRF